MSHYRRKLVALPAVSSLDISLLLRDSSGHQLADLSHQLSLRNTPSKANNAVAAAQGIQIRSRSSSTTTSSSRRVRFSDELLKQPETRTAATAPAAPTAAAVSGASSSHHRHHRGSEAERITWFGNTSCSSSSSSSSGSSSSKRTSGDYSSKPPKASNLHNVEICCPAVPTRETTTAWNGRRLEYEIDSASSSDSSTSSSACSAQSDESSGDEDARSASTVTTAAAANASRQLCRYYQRDIILHTIGAVIDRQLGAAAARKCVGRL